MGYQCIILDPEGNQELTHAWGLGCASNNETEALSIYHGLVLMKKRGLKSATVLGDSSARCLPSKTHPEFKY
jgi:ribonuclease HI